jgi:hypothetical protein
MKVNGRIIAVLCVGLAGIVLTNGRGRKAV